MPIKISKVTNDLKVGISTAVEYLSKHGIELDRNPNVRIDDTAVELLIKEFAKDADPAALMERYKSPARSAARDEEKPVVSAKPATAEVKPEPKRETKGVQEVRGPKVLGKVDLDKHGNIITAKPAAKPEPKSEPMPETKPEVKPEVEPESKPETKPEKKQEVKPEPKPEIKPEVKQEVKPESKPETKQAKKQEAKPEPKPEVKQETEDKKDDGVFRPISVPEMKGPKVLGTIDLSALNQTTRPRKKSKEELRRDRIEKSRQQNGGGAGSGSTERRGKRKRIGKEKIDIEKTANQPGFADKAKNDRNNRTANNNQRRDDRNKAKNQRNNQRKPEPREEDMQKQVKDTLARLTSKNIKSGAKWRKEKREEIHNRERLEAQREAAESSIIKITEFVTANDLANLMEVPVNKVIATCMSLGVMVSINQRLDAETINIVAEEFGFTTEYVSAEVSEAITVEEDSEDDLVPRSPIVTVMGHVDHGKTSLLDYIRKANVIAGEAGGITQHIGAYSVKMNDGRHITFLDTPGHEAFTAMRARGAKVTDIAIIIVAADDDVMPQTKEAINHATAANVPMVFAINKIDKPTANPDKIKEELASMNYLVEDWGGKYQSQDISAKKGIGVEELMEKVLLEAEMLDLKANPNRKAVGSIIESSLDKGRGYVATVLVQNGTLRQGDIILAGTHYGKIKAMFNERNQRVTEAPPATPVLVLGLNGAPTAGDKFNVMDSEQEAREIASKREQLQREQQQRTRKRPGLEEIGRRRALNDFHELNLIVKGDVDGSIEALSDSLIKLSTPEVQVNVLHKGVGAISESDVTLAAASDAIIIGFQVRPSAAARREADKEDVEIRLYSVIYKAIEEVKDAMEGMLAPEMKEEIIGNAEVLQTYHISKVGTIAGAIVRDGKIKRTSKVRLIRDGIVKYDGELGSLKRFKDDAKEVVSGFECGLSIQGYNDLKEGDIIEAYEEVAVKKTL